MHHPHHRNGWRSRIVVASRPAFTALVAFASPAGAIDFTFETVVPSGAGPAAIAVDETGIPCIVYEDLVTGGPMYTVWNGSGWDTEPAGAAIDPTSLYNFDLDLDPTGQPHLVHCWDNPTSNGVAYRFRDASGTWTRDVIDAVPSELDPFLLSRLEVDAAGRVHVISYQINRSIGDRLEYVRKDPGGDFELVLGIDGDRAADIALANEVSPRIVYLKEGGHGLYYLFPDPDGGSSWFTDQISGAGFAQLALVMEGSAIAHIANFTGNRTLRHVSNATGSWVETDIDTDENAGWQPSIALDENDVPHLAYSYSPTDDLRYATSAGGSWSERTLDAVGDTGHSSGIVMDVFGNPHIVYLDETNQAVRYAYIRDCDADGVSDADEIAAGTAFDCNGNGIPDECDVLTGAAEDCNGNGLADSCETDCNANGVPDDCDIAGGTSQDCNGDGVPDECEPDCDGDGVPDACDTFEDCNGNGVPDECDIADGTSYDCNINGVPDECDGLPDCNENGVPDRCDILDGTSGDCDFDDVPDECQASYADCNGNGIFDRCDIEDGTSLDCNVNLTPDECDLVDGFTDCDLDGVIDVCNLVLKLELDGASAGNEFGRAIASGDMNGDGLPDLMVGAPGFGARLVYVYLGGEPMDDVPDLELSGTGATFGTAIAVGDFNADTYDDVAVGAPHSGSGAKRVYVFLGSSVPDASADVVISAGTSGANNEFGAALAAVNVNGDANMDLAVGVPANGNAHVRIYLGDDLTSTWATLTGAGTSDEFGASVGNAGDVDGDGLEDVVVGEFESDVPGFPAAGRAHLFLSQPGGTPVPGPEYLGEAAGSRFGYTVSGAGDVNDDGFADVVVGAPYHATSVRGAAFLYLGDVVPDATVDLMIEGIDWFDPIGGTVGPAGDVNGDGIDDFLVGVGLGGFGDGLAHLYFGGDDLDAESERVFFAPLSYDGVGSVGPLGDIDGDGYPEFVVGGPEHDVQRGRVMIFDIDIPDFGDCNDNGDPDACDISGGASFDVNEDGIPDECQALSTETGSSTSLRTRLIGASPAPFGEAAEVRYELAAASHVVLEVFDAAGRRVAHVDEGPIAAGRHTIVWVGRDDGGRSLPSGAYFLSLWLDHERFSSRLVLLR